MRKILQNPASDYRRRRKGRLKRACPQYAAGTDVCSTQLRGLVNEWQNLTLRRGQGVRLRIAPAQFPKLRDGAVRRKLNHPAYGACVQKAWREIR
jgi:hypothetical protein